MSSVTEAGVVGELATTGFGAGGSGAFDRTGSSREGVTPVGFGLLLKHDLKMVVRPMASLMKEKHLLDA